MNTKSEAHDPKKDHNDPSGPLSNKPARNRYTKTGDFDPTDGWGPEVDQDPAVTPYEERKED